MSFRLLYYFLSLASCLNFSRAAENLHIAQSTLSQQIRQLEDYYGVQLFDRSGRSVSLTPAGLALQEVAARILEEEERGADLIRKIARDGSVRTYPLRICFDAHMVEDKFLAKDLLSAIADLEDEVADTINFRPTFIVRDLDEPRVSIQEVLHNNQVDFWMLGSETVLQHNEVQLEAIYDDQYGLMISERHPLYRDDLTIDDLPMLVSRSTLFLVQNRSKYVSKILNSLTAEGIRPALRYENVAAVNSMYVALGKGISIVPTNAEGISLPGVKMIPLPDTHFYTLAGRRANDENPLPARLLEHLRKRLADKYIMEH